MRRLVWRRPIWWGDLDARARGLASRLPTREKLARLAAAPGEPARVREAAALGLAEAPVGGDLERHARRVAAASLARLARWAGPRTRALRVVFEDEDRRSVGSLLRGAAQGASSERRLSGLVPTPTLPEPALETLAHGRSIGDVVHRLEALGHPWGRDLAARLEAAPADLFALGLEVDRLFARRAVDSARRGGRTLETYARQIVDLLNAWSVFVADGWFPEAGPEDVFLPGGRALSAERFAALVAAGPASRRAGLAALFRGALGRVFADPSAELSTIEARALRAMIAEQRRAVLVEPLGPSPVLWYALRLRAHVVDLSRIACGLALGADPRTIVRELVTP